MGCRVGDLLYPPSCPGCGKTTTTGQTDVLCTICKQRTRPIRPPFCKGCGETWPAGVPGDSTCSNCGGKPLPFAFAIAAYESFGVVRDMVHRFKYRRELHLRTCLVHLLSEALDDPRISAGDGWLLVPVPLHAKRFREREFNQASELCRGLAKTQVLPVVEPLRRVRYTQPQARLDRHQRLENLRGAFTLAPHASEILKSRNILLIDDVFTTGATAAGCARVLTEDGGAQKVAVLTVARG